MSPIELLGHKEKASMSKHVSNWAILNWRTRGKCKRREEKGREGRRADTLNMSKTCGLKLSKIQASEIEQSLTTLKIKGNLKFTKRALTHEFQNSKQSLYLTHRPYSSIFYVWPRYVFLQLTSNGTHKKIRNMENKGGTRERKRM